MTAPTAARVLAFLQSTGAYPHASRVEAIETHWSWVFLTDRDAYKLKKPIVHDGVDLSSLANRRRNCEAEVRLNRRLAAPIYLGLVPVTEHLEKAESTVALAGSGTPVEWLVHMRRLPADRMLDATIGRGLEPEDEARIRAAAEHLARFYVRAPAESMSGREQRAFLRAGIESDRRELTQPGAGVPAESVERLARFQLNYLDRSPDQLDRRVAAGHLVDGHGDLRPEHVCLLPEPAIIDCLEFSKRLRTMDPADELAFLGLECERLGRPEVGNWFLQVYTHVTSDDPPAALLHFYRMHRALRRAKIASRRFQDPQARDPEAYAEQARRYLQLGGS